MELLCWLVQIYLIICIVRVILSWIQLEDQGVIGAIGTLTYTVTEPIFATVRRYLPIPGDIPIDFSPAVVILGLSLLRQLFCTVG